ncbi:hypothetical protein BAUCODRAFT_152279 [Baudoinia panamericana UAMH 10762]|uniref:RRM domain-containing protein n=1 Tax=Baudoinia panamericana (strain UAMH 10762) TaxID=717646 RepID=M2LD86_BAUPA|nr:uncharacterized protein BAUCODRAFT_152279 [Baudoinia panamericana UAMH 10762]EMC91922.1 hypothetical protein BAUCODRAFT_152279 [Baudoinia panamericana UAMH 10762]
MSGKLDQSLDTIMAEGGNKGGRRGRRVPARRAAGAKPAVAAPTGGVQKTTRAPRTTASAPTAPASGDSKIIVSNLPQDITELLLKDFFAKAVGSVKKVLLSYGPNGRSRGEATVIFSKPNAAAEAMKQFNNVKVDNRPMKIEIVGSSIAAPAKQTMADRMAKPKNASKESAKAAAAPKKDAAKPAADAAAKAGRGGKKRSGRAGRPKAKTADELDAEMADYFGGGEGAPNGAAATNGAVQPAATNGNDAAMDEVL